MATIIILADQLEQANPTFAPSSAPFQPTSITPTPIAMPPAPAPKKFEIEPEGAQEISTMRSDDTRPIKEPETHDSGLDALVKKYISEKDPTNPKRHTDKQNATMEQIFNYPFEGSTIGGYFKKLLKDYAKRLPREQIDSKFPVSDPTSDVYALMGKALDLSNADKIKSLPAYMKFLARTYGKKDRTWGVERAKKKMNDYVEWFKDKSKSNGGEVPGAENMPWEDFKDAAWKQYQKENWIDDSGNPIDIPAAIKWINETAATHADIIKAAIPGGKGDGPFSAGVYPTNATPAMLNLIQKLQNAGVNVPYKDRNDPAALNKVVESAELEYKIKELKKANVSIPEGIDPASIDQLVASYNATAKASKKISTKPIFQRLPTEINDANKKSMTPRNDPGATIKLKEALVDAGVPIPSQYDITLEMLKPSQMAMGPQYLDRIYRGEGSSGTTQTIDERTTGEGDRETNDEDHRSKYDDLAPRGADEHTERHDYMNNQDDIPIIQRPKPAQAPAAPTSDFPSTYFDFEGTPDEKAKAKGRAAFVSPSHPKYKQVLDSIGKTFGPEEQIYKDACDMFAQLGDEKAGEALDRAATRKRNKLLGDDFARGHADELAQFGGEDIGSNFRRFKEKLWQKIMKSISNDQTYQNLVKQFSEPVAAGIKQMARIMLFAARTEIISE